MSKKDIEQLRALIESAEKSIEEAKNVFKKLTGDELSAPVKSARSVSFNAGEDSGKIIEGRFDGQSMIDDTGKLYPVPANYASKSKLVEGDRLKLTVSGDGSFVFKQIGPVDRKRVIATVKQDAAARGYVLEAEGKIYKVLLASVTYFKVGSGDSVVALIPKDKDSAWAAIENALQGGGSINQDYINSGDSGKSLSSREDFSGKNDPIKDIDIDELIGQTVAELEKQEGEAQPVVQPIGERGKVNEFEW